MAKDFDPGFLLNVATKANFRFHVVQGHTAWFLEQGLNFKNRKGMARLQNDFVELAMQPLERVDFEYAFNTHSPCDRRVVVALSVGQGERHRWRYRRGS